MRRAIKPEETYGLKKADGWCLCGTGRGKRTMSEKILQGMRLILTAGACYGFLRSAMRIFRLRAEFALPVSFAAVGLVMILGGILGFLLPTAWLLLAAGIGLAGMSLFYRESLRPILTPGVLFFFVCAAFFLLLLYGSRLTHVDNFSHWGAILRLIESGDALPEHNRLVYFPAYPTGSSLVIYWFVKMSGIHAEWFWAWVQSLLLAACAAPLFCFVEGERASRPWCLALTLLTALACLCGNTDLTDLLVDTLVPMLGLAGVLLCLYGRERLTQLTLPLAILTAYLPMVKNSGYFFAGLLLAFALCVGGKGALRWRAFGFMALALLAANRLWSWHVRTAFDNGLGSYHAVSLQNFSKSFGMKSAEDLRTITLALVDALFREGRLVWLALSLAAVLLLCHTAKERRLKRLCLALPVIWALYLVSLLGMYFFSMSVGEAGHAAAFDRYYRIITVFSTGYLWVQVCLVLPELRRKARLPAAAAACALLLGLCAPRPEYLLRQSRRMDDSLALRIRFDTLIEERKIPPEQGYLVFSSPEHEILSRVMCTYLLHPTITVVCTEPDTMDEDIGRTDYFIILDDTEAAEALRGRFGTDEPCGWVYDYID